MLDSVNVTFKLSPYEVEEYEDFKIIFNIKKVLISTNGSLAKLDSNSKNQLRIIALKNNDNIASIMARQCLCFFYKECYPNAKNRLSNSERIKTGSKIDASRSKSVSVSPNPTKDFISFSSLESEFFIRKVSLLDIFGRLVLEKSFNTETHIEIIDVHSLSKGIYIFQVLTSEGDMQTGKIEIIK
jgi:Secretion system C-terminal sorting domain